MEKKNKFPIAKIKRIIQSNQEVGKVSSTTPILISKCLEMFIEDLIVETSKITKNKQSKTMTVQHLKECIDNNDKFEILRKN